MADQRLPNAAFLISAAHQSQLKAQSLRPSGRPNKQRVKSRYTNKALTGSQPGENPGRH